MGLPARGRKPSGALSRVIGFFNVSYNLVHHLSCWCCMPQYEIGLSTSSQRNIYQESLLTCQHSLLLIWMLIWCTIWIYLTINLTPYRNPTYWKVSARIKSFPSLIFLFWIYILFFRSIFVWKIILSEQNTLIIWSRFSATSSKKTILIVSL